MSFLSDEAVAHLARVMTLPELPGGRYRILEPIGAGGMGTVYLAEDVALERRVAIKVMNDARDAAHMTERLRREALTVARLDHPSVVPIHDVGQAADGRAYYVMKHVQGCTLAEWRRSARPLHALRLFLRVCDAVGHAHAQGVVHRDLKPENIMVGAAGEVFVMDWGIARTTGGAAKEGAVHAGAVGADGRRTAHGDVIGTPGYMAPEQARGDSAVADARADVHALGGLLAFLWTGRGPDRAGSFELHGVPRPLCAVIRKARAPEASGRYGSVLELGRDVAAFLDREPVRAYREPLHERVGRFLARNQFVAWLVVGYLALRAAVFVWSGR